jgi:hypothetical protein
MPADARAPESRSNVQDSFNVPEEDGTMQRGKIPDAQELRVICEFS